MSLKFIDAWEVDYREEGDYIIVTPKFWKTKIKAGETIGFGIQGIGEGSTDFKYELVEK